MNSKMQNQIIDFMNNIGRYLEWEYDPKYLETLLDKSNLHSLYEFIGSYYMGGSTVPETARYVIEFIERFIWSAND